MSTQPRKRVRLIGNDLGVTNMIIQTFSDRYDTVPVIPVVAIPYYQQFNKHSYKQKK